MDWSKFENITWEQVQEQFRTWSQSDVFWYCVGVAALVLACVIFLSMLRRRVRPIRLHHTTHGTVQISKAALIDGIQAVCIKEGLQRRPSVKLAVKRGKLHLCLDVRLNEHPSLESLTARLQDAVESLLRDQLGITTLGNININISRLTLDKNKVATAVPTIAQHTKLEVPPRDKP